MGLEDITLADFKKCLKGDYSPINGDNDIWLGLYDEYNQALNTKGNDVAFEIKKQIYILENEHNIIKACLFVIAELIKSNHINMDNIHEYETFIKNIETFGFAFDRANPVDSLIRVNGQIKNYETRKKSEKKKLEDIEKKGGKWSFNKTVVAVGKYMGYKIPEKETTMLDFVDMFNMMINTNTNG